MERFEKKIYKLFPIFGRAMLDPVKEFSSLIGHPHTKFRSIHVAGTNGKGSVWHKISEALRLGARRVNLTNFKVGKYISPHIHEFNERISVNGNYISNDDISRIGSDLLKVRELHQDECMDLNQFDLFTMIAFKYFEEQNVDYAVVEVGIGGNLDPTNIITPEISIITSIGYDHLSILGPTLEIISESKMGIWKPGIPVIIGPDCPVEYMLQYAESTLGLDKTQFTILEKHDEFLNNYEVENSSIATKAWQVLRDTSTDSKHNLSKILTDDVIYEAVSSKLEGRLQVVFNSQNQIFPEEHKFTNIDKVYLDAGHNPSGISKSISTLFSELSADAKLTLIIGFFKIENTTNNLRAILEHEMFHRINNVVLVEHSAINADNFEPKRITLKEQSELIKEIENLEKVKVFDGRNLIDINQETELLENYGYVFPTLDYLHNQEDLERTNILIIGTFRLQHSIIEYYKE